MNRISLTNDINHYLSLFTLEVEKFNKLNLYDVNIHAENSVIPLLNEVYGVDLSNANLIEKNFPAVDLVDYENRIAIQVTASADSEKITYTINKFLEKGLFNSFDTLIIYILTKKLDYKKDFSALTNNEFIFDNDSHIIDNTDLFKTISSNPNLTLLKKVREHLVNEFSPEKISEREQIINNEIVVLPPEPYILNFVEIAPPESLYIAKLDLDKERDKLTDEVNQYRASQTKKRWRGKIKDRDLVRKAIANLGLGFFHDWVLFKGNLITFHNLHDPADPLRKLVDIGTIETLPASDFWQKDENYLRVFKSLLGMSLRQKFVKIGLEWQADSEIFRFRASTALSPIKVTWKKDKRSSTREVFSEVWNKDKTHIVCFRHLGFSLSQEVFDDKWFIAIKPTWSFTSNGKQTSKFESGNLSGMKRLENNSAVHNHFRFIADYISKDQDIEAPKSLQPNDDNKAEASYEIAIGKPVFFEYRPSIKDNDWLPEKTTN